MFLLLFLLVQAPQSQRLPWGFLVLFGLLAVAAVGLLIYFMTRVRKSEKDAEEDWGFSRRGILLSPLQDVKKSEALPEPPEALHLSTKREPPLLASEIDEPRVAQPVSVAEHPSPAEPQVFAMTSPQVNSAEASEIPPPVYEQQSGFQQQHEELGAHEEMVAPQPQPADQGSPFDEEIWSQLQSPPVDELEVKPPSAVVAGRRERYEPPRIIPIVPRTDQSRRADSPRRETSDPLPASQQSLARQAQKADLPRRETTRSLSASEQSPASQPRLEVRPTVVKSPRRSAAPAGSILGLPAEASSGPLIMGRSRGFQDSRAVGTLANYDMPPDDTAGHSGTVALVSVIVLVCSLLAAYLTISPVHTRVDNWVAWVRGVQEPAKSVAQVFPSTLDESKDPADAKGTLQNISDHSLSNLMIIISLDPRGGGTAVSQDVQVSPDEIQPGQQGTYEFQIERNKYRSYKVVGLKTKDGAMLPYDKPSQQQ